MFPFTRASEREKPRGDYSRGVLVKLENGRRYFFPGGEPELAMILAHAALADADLEHPNTAIEFGERSGDRGELWLSLKTLKASALVPVDGSDTI